MSKRPDASFFELETFVILKSDDNGMDDHHHAITYSSDLAFSFDLENGLSTESTRFSEEILGFDLLRINRNLIGGCPFVYRQKEDRDNDE